MAKPRYRLAPTDGSLKITSELYFPSTHFNYSNVSITCKLQFVKAFFSVECGVLSVEC